MRELETEVKIIEPILGKTIESVSVSDDKEELFFIFTDHSMTKFYHFQECCESVSIESIDGDLDDLVGEPLLQAEEVARGGELDVQDWDSRTYTWTFYKFATNKGYVTIRWYGESNGYYSEGVDIKHYTRDVGGVFRQYLNEYRDYNSFNPFDPNKLPISVYIKEDGYNVLFYYDSVDDSLKATSRDRNYGSDYYVTFLKGVIGEKGIERLKMYCKGENASVIYELIDPINDPHIIEYPERTALMLDIMDNAMEVKLKPFNEVYSLSCYIGSPCNDPVYSIDSTSIYEKFLSEIKRKDHMFNGGYVAGYVFEDANGERLVQETGYYQLWEHLKFVMKYGYVYAGKDDIEPKFYKFVKNNKENVASLKEKLLKNVSKDIADKHDLILYRKLFLEQLEKESK